MKWLFVIGLIFLLVCGCTDPSDIQSEPVNQTPVNSTSDVRVGIVITPSGGEIGIELAPGIGMGLGSGTLGIGVF